MPDADLVCEVRVQSGNGTGAASGQTGVYRDWTSVVIAWSFADRSWFRNFRLVCAEPSKLADFRLKPGDRVDIAIAGQVIIQEGYIVNRQAAYDANRHAVQIDGYSKAGQITKASADVGTGQFRGYKLDAIANSLLKPYGMKFRLDNPPEGANEKFENVMIRKGETPFAAISRLCNQRGLWLQADAKGNLVAGSPDGGSSVTFIEGVNILAANCSIAMPAVQDVITNAQKSGSDSLFGKKASEIQAKGTMPAGPAGQKRIVLAEMPLSEKEAQLRTNMEMQAIEASLLRVTLTYQGWLRPGAGGLWELLAKDTVKVKSPMLFPIESGEMDLKLWGVTYSQDAQAGTTTTIELVNKGAFAISHPDATQNDGWYGGGAQEAKPEAVT